MGAEHGGKTQACINSIDIAISKSKSSSTTKLRVIAVAQAEVEIVGFIKWTKQFLSTDQVDDELVVPLIYEVKLPHVLRTLPDIRVLPQTV